MSDPLNPTSQLPLEASGPPEENANAASQAEAIIVNPIPHPNPVPPHARRGEIGRRTCGRFRAADRNRFPLVSETAGIPRDRCLIMPIPRVSPRTPPCRPSTRQPTLSPS